MRIADQTRAGTSDSTSFLSALVGDGRPLLALVALGLILSGLFAIFLTITGAFLPHDVAFLGMQPSELCRLHDCRIVHFIFHDRTSFGGTLIAIGTLYLWLLEFPLRRGEEWAWWTLLLSGLIGFRPRNHPPARPRPPRRSKAASEEMASGLIRGGTHRRQRTSPRGYPPGG
jgi:hypothetical protein